MLSHQALLQEQLHACLEHWNQNVRALIDSCDNDKIFTFFNCLILTDNSGFERIFSVIRIFITEIDRFDCHDSNSVTAGIRGQPRTFLFHCYSHAGKKSHFPRYAPVPGEVIETYQSTSQSGENLRQ
jgi:hypothetical protein